MTQEVIQTSRLDAEQAVNEICSKLKKAKSAYTAIIFFASIEYDFKKLSELLKENFPQAEVVGSSTAGEITADGFTKRSLVVNALADSGSVRTQFSGVLLEDANNFPIVYKDDIIKAASAIGISLSSAGISRNSFAMTFICGLLNAEEIVLSVLYSLVKDSDFLTAGGSAGDDMRFQKTLVSYNGKVSDMGAVILFVKTTGKFTIYKENIFQPSGKHVMLTQVDPEKHIISSIDGQNPKKRYAQVLGINEANVANALLDHPFGRVFGNEVFIASLVQFDMAGKLTTYARVLQNSVQEILEPVDVLNTAENSCKDVLEEIKNPGCVILFNCILRTVGFEKHNQQASVNSVWKKYFPTYSGFSNSLRQAFQSFSRMRASNSGNSRQVSRISV